MYVYVNIIVNYDRKSEKLEGSILINNMANIRPTYSPVLRRADSENNLYDLGGGLVHIYHILVGSMIMKPSI